MVKLTADGGCIAAILVSSHGLATNQPSLVVPGRWLRGKLTTEMGIEMVAGCRSWLTWWQLQPIVETPNCSCSPQISRALDEIFVSPKEPSARCLAMCALTMDPR